MTYRTLVATAKNEGPYLWEWAAHHLMIGFDHIVIFQNDSDDLTPGICHALQKTGRVSFYNNEHEAGGHQRRAYQRARNVPAYQKADWVMALDIDEFLCLKGGDATLDALQKTLPEADAILINWRIFGSSGLAQRTDELTTKRFSQAQPLNGRLSGIKTLFRRDRFDRPGIHVPAQKPDVDNYTYINGSGLSEADFALCDWQCTDPMKRHLCQVNHYILRDAESFLLKVSRGRAHQVYNTVNHAYWTRWDQNVAKDTTLADRSAALQVEMDHLDQQTGGELSALTARANHRHDGRIQVLLKDDAYVDLLNHCTNVMKPVTHADIHAARMTPATQVSEKAEFKHFSAYRKEEILQYEALGEKRPEYHDMPRRIQHWLRQTLETMDRLVSEDVHIPKSFLTPYLIPKADFFKLQQEFSDEDKKPVMQVIQPKYQLRGYNLLRELSRMASFAPELLQHGPSQSVLELSAGSAAAAEICKEYGHSYKPVDYLGGRGSVYALLHHYLGVDADDFNGTQRPYKFDTDSVDYIFCYQAIDAYGSEEEYLACIQEMGRIARKKVVVVFNITDINVFYGPLMLANSEFCQNLQAGLGGGEVAWEICPATKLFALLWTLPGWENQD